MARSQLSLSTVWNFPCSQWEPDLIFLYHSSWQLLQTSKWSTIMYAGCRMGDTTPRGSIIVTDIVIIQLEQGTEMIGILSRTNLSDLSVIDGLRVSTGHFQFIPGNQQLPRRRVIRSPLPPPTICYFPSSN